MVQKLMKLLDAEALPSETDILASALSIADKVAYKVLTPKQIIVNIDDKALKSFWEQFKDKYVTTRSYTLAILCTDSAGTEVTEKEVHDFYDKNSYNYVGADGKLFTFEQAKAIVEQDYKVKKTKKQALKEYVAYKKGERKATETKEIAENSPELSTALWAEITKAKTGDLLKPKAVSSKYATVKLIKITEPQTKSFEQAKVQVTAELTAQKKNELLENKSNAALKNIENEQLTTTDWVTMSKFDNLTPLSQQESKQFLEKLFTSSAKTGMITVSDNVVVYKIVEQKMDSVDRNLTTTVEGYVIQIKKSVFEANLFKTLNETYPAQKFVKGI
jgi:peptidyl-prolyl cis-trans isomerase D